MDDNTDALLRQPVIRRILLHIPLNVMSSRQTKYYTVVAIIYGSWRAESFVYRIDEYWWEWIKTWMKTLHLLKSIVEHLRYFLIIHIISECKTGYELNNFLIESQHCIYFFFIRSSLFQFYQVLKIFMRLFLFVCSSARACFSKTIWPKKLEIQYNIRSCEPPHFL